MIFHTYFELLYDRVLLDYKYNNKAHFLNSCLKNAGLGGIIKYDYSNNSSNNSGMNKYAAGSRAMPKNVKDVINGIKKDKVFNVFNLEMLTEFFQKTFSNDNIRYIVDKLDFENGIIELNNKHIYCICKALAFQLKEFWLLDNPKTDLKLQVYDKYQDYLSSYKNDCKNKPKHDGDSCTVVNSNNIYFPNIYDSFKHEWKILNSGSKTWINRKLILSNKDELSVKAKPEEIDIPETPSKGEVQLSVEIDVRGFEQEVECKWIMIDQAGDECFPGEEYFFFTIRTEFKI